MAMVVVLSVFNGFGGIVEGMFSAFDPDLKITVREGKVFNYNTPQFDEALRVEGIQMISESLEENALFSFNGQQVPVLMKGVSQEFSNMTDMEKLMVDGDRKSTRLNSSHVRISYAVFCLKKKTKQKKYKRITF